MFEKSDKVKLIDGGICAVSDVQAAGFKEGKYGVSIIVSPNSKAAGVFTSNKVVAAPITHTKEVLKDGRLSAIIINSGNANCFTGEQGIEDCDTIVSHASELLGIPSSEIASSSTGVIGRKMPMDIILPLIDKVYPNLDHSTEASTDATRGMMTTDMHVKQGAVEVEINGKPVKIGGICKGSGMIAPNMGTMLCFIATDAEIDSREIQIAIKNAVDVSFNMVVVDGDQSTNDTAILMANGQSGVNVAPKGVINKDFQNALTYLCMSLAKQMARDGEGETKFLEVNVEGGRSPEDAKLAAKAVVSSMLFKAAVFGGDPNWGRIVSAVGYSGCEFDPDIVSIAIGCESLFRNKDTDKSVYLVKDGEILAFDGTENLNKAEELMAYEDIVVDINLNMSDGEATAWGCDLSYDYVKINGEYTT
ncbi:MAG: bifunctional ornithine acetyltransferase/N-acetylglutamate synthase [Methanobrevibacter sp.]